MQYSMRPPSEKKSNTPTLNHRETPLEGFFNRDGGLRIFKLFGCTALMYVPLKNRTKLEETAERGIHYQIYCPGRKGILLTCDGTFIDEDGDQLIIEGNDSFRDLEKQTRQTRCFHEAEDDREKKVG